MTNELRRVVAGSLAAAVLIGASAGAASATVFDGGLAFLPDNWQEGAADAFSGGLTYPNTWEDGQVAEEARQAAEAEAARAAKEMAQAKAEAARVVAEAEAEAARIAAEARAEAAELAEAAPTNLGAAVADPANLGAGAGATVQIIPRTTVNLDLLEITWEELIGPFPEGEQNTAALAAWDWLMLVKGWRGVPDDGQERLVAPEHPDYARSVLVRELPESVWCYPILPGSDVTDHAADVLRAAGWYEADLYEPGGTPWLLPPEAAN